MLDAPTDLATGPAGGRRRAARPWAGISGDAAASGALSLPALLSILRRQRGPFLFCALLMPLLAAFALHHIPPRYTATGTVMFEPSAYALQELQSILHVDPTTDPVMASQAELLHSLRIADRLVARFHLDRDPQFNPALRPPSIVARVLARLSWLRPPPPPGPKQPGEAREAVVQAVDDAITVQVIHASRVIAASFTADDAGLAAAATNAIMDLYIADQLDTKLGAVRSAASWLDTRVAELRRDVQDKEDRIALYRADAGLSQGVQAGLATERLSRLNADLLQARSGLEQASARLEAARSGPRGALPQATIAQSVVTARTARDTLAGQLRALETRLGPHHPDVLALRDQLADAQQAVAAEAGRFEAVAETEVRADREAVAVLEQRLRDAEALGGRNAQAEIPLNAMEREAAASRTLLQTLLERVQQTAQQAAIEVPDARIISPALTPLRPSFPKTGPMLGAAAAFGVFAGLLCVYLLELADSTLRSGDDVRSLLGLPCFALVPQLGGRALGRGRVADYVAHKPLSPFAEQMRVLRTGLWLAADRPKVVAVTAARPAEGKTTVALALARSVALDGARVIALDCDVRQPSFGQLMRVGAALGLVDFLQGHASLDAVIRRDTLTTMDYIPAGPAEMNALGLFMSDAMGALIARLRQDYDLVLLDAPPALAMADARVVARLADATVLCVRWRDTPRSVVASSLDLLDDARAHVTGVVLTRVDARVHVRSGFADAEVYHPRLGGYLRE